MDGNPGAFAVPACNETTLQLPAITNWDANEVSVTMRITHLGKPSMYTEWDDFYRTYVFYQEQSMGNLTLWLPPNVTTRDQYILKFKIRKEESTREYELYV